MRKAIFVVVEGADACGKTTQVEMLARRFVASGSLATRMSFPRYDTDVGKAIERHLKGKIYLCENDEEREWKRAPEDALAFQALQTMDKLEAAVDILNRLKSGTSVVSSRWWQSAVIYGADLGLDAGRLVRAHSLLPQADLNVLLTLSEEESLARRPELRDRFERDREKQARVRAAYLDMWKVRMVAEPLAWTVVDGSGTSKEVHEKIWSCVVAQRQKSDFPEGFSCIHCGRRRCVVPGCENHTDQEEFVGDFCLPCYRYLVGQTQDTHGRSQAFRNELERSEDRLRKEVCRLLGTALGLEKTVVRPSIDDRELLNLLRGDKSG